MKKDHKAQLKVGIFTLLGLLLIGILTVFVNDRPFWWRSCKLVHINVEDATGLKTKSPIRSLGLQIGYLKSVGLYETHVKLAICITAPVEVLPNTRAYIRGEGFLGDKFVELKPVKYTGSRPEGVDEPDEPIGAEPEVSTSSWLNDVWDVLFPSAYAQDDKKKKGSGKSVPQIPVGKGSQDVQSLVGQVDTLVGELTDLTTNLKKTFDPHELQRTMDKLNSTLENASKTLSPEGNLTTTAQRTLAKLEDAIEQFRDQLAKVNQGRGSVGRLLNDPVYADEIERALKNLNKLLNKADQMKLVVNVGGEYIFGYGSGRGFGKVGIWPGPDRYYLLGVSVDPRGKITSSSTTTTVAGVSTTTTTTVHEKSGLLFTAMLGKILWDRIDLSIGVLHGDAALGFGVLLGPEEAWENRIQIRNELFLHSLGENVDTQVDDRVYARVFPLDVEPFNTVYVQAGLESVVRKVDGKIGFSIGAGISFDDNDIKTLFAFF